MKKKKKDTPEPFETTLERLEDVVRDLESGEKGLEASLELFENGVGLAAKLSERLEAVKHRVSVLTKEGGRFKSRPIEEEDQ